MKTSFTNKILIIVLIGVSILLPLLLLVPSKNRAADNKLDLEKFVLVVPQGWKHVPSQGLDSFIGSIEGEGIKLDFEYGWYGSTRITKESSHYFVLTEIVV